MTGRPMTFLPRSSASVDKNLYTSRLHENQDHKLGKQKNKNRLARL